MFFDHVRQVPQTEREYQVHYTVFARRIESGFGAVFGIREPICPSIAIGSTGVRIFIWGRLRSMGRRGIERERDIRSNHIEAFRGTIDCIRVAARSHRHRHAVFNAGQLDVGEGRREDDDEGGDDFAKGDDEAELALDTLRHIIIK